MTTSCPKCGSPMWNSGAPLVAIGGTQFAYCSECPYKEPVARTSDPAEEILNRALSHVDGTGLFDTEVR